MERLLVKALFDRELGNRTSQSFANFEHQTILDFRISNRKALSTFTQTSQQRSSRTITWLALEKRTHQLLLATTKEGNILLFNTKVPDECTDGVEYHLPISPMDCQHQPHQGPVTCAVWYPIDQGIFLTASLDSKVIVWDANRLEVAFEWDLRTSVNCLAMSELQGHCLVAAGTEDGQIRICDLSSGSHLHSLQDRTPLNSSQVPLLDRLTSSDAGDASGQLLLWDIRRSGTVLCFDDHAQDQMHPRAHCGAINAVLSSVSGRYWISAGTDDRIKLWDAHLHHKSLTIQQDAFNRSLKPRQLSMTADGQLLFFPSGSVVQVYDLTSGDSRKTLKTGGLSSINCCVFNADSIELYIGLNEQRFLTVLEPSKTSFEDSDSWSE